MDDNCGEWVESMGVVVRRYIDFLILLIPTLVSVLFTAASLLFVHFFKMFFRSLYNYSEVIIII